MVRFFQLLIGTTLTLALFAASGRAQTQSVKAMPMDKQRVPESYQTLYIKNLSQQGEANDLLQVLRNMFTNTSSYVLPSRNAITMHGTPEDLVAAQKLFTELDRPRKMYRLTYNIYGMDGGKRDSAQTFTMVVVSGAKTELKRGVRVPVSIIKAANSQGNTETQYVDVGVNITASLEGTSDGATLRSKVEQSSVAEEKPRVGADPVIQQSVLEGTATLVLGKPLILGSIDSPGDKGRQEIEVLSELIAK